MELTQRLIVCDMCDSEQVAVAGRKAIQWINLSGTASGASETLEPTHKWIVKQFILPVGDAVPRGSVGRPSLTDVRLVSKVKIQDLTPAPQAARWRPLHTGRSHCRVYDEEIVLAPDMENDREEQRRDNESQQPSAAPVACPLGWWRGALLILLLNTTFFYQGCDRNSTYLSIGAASPFMVVAVTDEANWPTRLVSTSFTALIAGLILLSVALLLICRFVPWLSRLLASRTFLVALSLSVAVLNSFLVSPVVWSYTARLPTMYLIEPIESLLHDDTSSASVIGDADVVIAARLYFLLLIVGLYLVIRLVSYVLRRFVLVDAERWWQFRLGGLMATAVILGTGIGLVVRLIMQE